jgi:predicted ATP-dependent endonuclease of OLD family
MRTFLDKINIVRPIFNKSLSDIIKERRLLTQYEIDYNKTKLAEEIISKILRGKYQYDKDGEKIFYETNKYVKLNFSSSGQQESLWILLLLFIIILEKQNVFIVIEEPEAHLFPEAQKEISNLIALMSNVENSQVIITTHSPYILASLNNLILANKVGSKNINVEKRINKNLWINRDKVYAALVTKGQVKDIIDNELNIIQQENIDSVSGTINDEFDFLFQFETV